MLFWIVVLEVSVEILMPFNVDLQALCLLAGFHGDSTNETGHPSLESDVVPKTAFRHIDALAIILNGPRHLYRVWIVWQHPASGIALDKYQRQVDRISEIIRTIKERGPAFVAFQVWEPVQLRVIKDSASSAGLKNTDVAGHNKHVGRLRVFRDVDAIESKRTTWPRVQACFTRFVNVLEHFIFPELLRPICCTCRRKSLTPSVPETDLRMSSLAFRLVRKIGFPRN